jgi:N-acetylneuraminate synthase
MHRTTVIAEIGINHNGSLEAAKRLIDVAKVAGADAVKFQKRTPELCVSPTMRDSKRETPWGEMTYLEYRHRLEFGREEFDAIDRYCRAQQIEWFLSVWDLPSLEFALSYEPRSLKIPSAMLTHTRLLRGAAATGIRTFVSTGMSTESEVDRAAEIFRGEAAPFVLMHCHSSYPAPSEELDLDCIRSLRERYDCPVGYSGHEFGLVPSIVAVSLGAVAIERHITLDRNMYGSDQRASVEPVGLIKLVKFVRSAESVRGDGCVKLHASEQPARDKLRFVHPSEREANPTRRPISPPPLSTPVVHQR